MSSIRSSKVEIDVPIGHPKSTLIEQYDAAKGCQSGDPRGKLRKFPEHLDIRDAAQHDYDVEGGVAHNLVSDADVAAFRIFGQRSGGHPNTDH